MHFAQNPNSLLGKMLRIDVNTLPYTSPPTNPFFGIAGADEIWHYGLRNPRDQISSRPVRPTYGLDAGIR